MSASYFLARSSSDSCLVGDKVSAFQVRIFRPLCCNLVFQVCSLQTSVVLPGVAVEVRGGSEAGGCRAENGSSGEGWLLPLARRAISMASPMREGEGDRKGPAVVTPFGSELLGRSDPDSSHIGFPACCACGCLPGTDVVGVSGGVFPDGVFLFYFDDDLVVVGAHVVVVYAALVVADVHATSGSQAVAVWCSPTCCTCLGVSGHSCLCLDIPVPSRQTDRCVPPPSSRC